MGLDIMRRCKAMHSLRWTSAPMASGSSCPAPSHVCKRLSKVQQLQPRSWKARLQSSMPAWLLSSQTPSTSSRRTWVVRIRPPLHVVVIAAAADKRGHPRILWSSPSGVGCSHSERSHAAQAYQQHSRRGCAELLGELQSAQQHFEAQLQAAHDTAATARQAHGESTSAALAGVEGQVAALEAAVAAAREQQGADRHAAGAAAGALDAKLDDVRCAPCLPQCVRLGLCYY
jgi:hypothetical protein